jgi:hypothetical protein
MSRSLACDASRGAAFQGGYAGILAGILVEAKMPP